MVRSRNRPTVLIHEIINKEINSVTILSSFDVKANDSPRARPRPERFETMARQTRFDLEVPTRTRAVLEDPIQDQG